MKQAIRSGVLAYFASVAQDCYELTCPLTCALLLLFSLSPLPGCGSGGSAGSGSVKTSAPTIISLSPGSAKAGGSAFTLTVNGTAFTPSGTTVSWNGTALATTFLNPTEATVPVTSALIAKAGTATVTVTTPGGTSPGATFTVNPAPSSPQVTAAHAPIRTRYLRTNSFYDPNSLQFAPPHFSVYDSAHQQFFVSNPYLNEIDVFSAASELQTGAISVPLAWGIDISPVDGTLWAGTLLGDVYHINTATASVMARFPSSNIGPSGFVGTTVLVLADGRLVLQGGAGGILGVDGFGVNVIWTPSTNALNTGSSGTGTLCAGNGGIALDGTRTYVLVTTVDEAGSPLPLCSYNSATEVATYTTYVPATATFVRQIVPTPDGTKVFVTTNLDGVEVFDPKTLQPIGKIGPPGDGLPNAAGGAVMSLDGKTLYLVDQLTGTIFGYDATSYQHVSTVAHPEVSDLQRWMVASAMDPTGLIIGPIGHGVGFADAGVPETNSTSDLGALVSLAPNTGPVAGGTAITAGVDAGTTPPSTLAQFYIGNSLIFGANTNAGSGGNFVDATTPEANSGRAVDLTAVFSEGTVALAPEAYSYGPTVLEVVPNAASGDGGQLGALIGYGFGSSATALQITVGGQTAQIQNLYDYAPIDPYPFPVETVTFTIPPGAAGATAISVTSASGSATGAFTYTPKSVSFPLSAGLQQGIYDAHRNLYYFSDTAKIQVFSPASGTWQTTITLPGTTSSSQLLGISESPNGSLLAVCDYGGQALYVLDPATPATVNRYPTPIEGSGLVLLAPIGLAALDNGNIYFTAASIGPARAPTVHELSTATGQFTDLPSTAGGKPSDGYDRVLLSPDQTKVYVNLEGSTLWIDTTTNTVNTVAVNSGGGEIDGAISGDGSTVDFNGYFADALLNPENVPAYLDWETWLPTAVLGHKLNQDGSVLYRPLTDGIDLLERNTGRLLYRVQVPGTLANVYDSMFLGASAGTLGYITNAGITFVDLSSLSIPAAASTPFPAANVAQKARVAEGARTAGNYLPSTRRSRPGLQYERKTSASGWAASY